MHVLRMAVGQYAYRSRRQHHRCTDALGEGTNAPGEAPSASADLDDDAIVDVQAINRFGKGCHRGRDDRGDARNVGEGR